jgi:hypothetical protein
MASSNPGVIKKKRRQVGLLARDFCAKNPLQKSRPRANGAGEVRLRSIVIDLSPRNTFRF